MSDKIKLKPKGKIEIIDWDGASHLALRPNLGQLKAFEDAIEEAKVKGTGLQGVMINFLTGSGLEKGFVESLDAEEVETIVEALGTKKKR